MHYFLFFAAAGLLAFLLTAPIKKLAQKFFIVDSAGQPRKIHLGPKPLLGGAAIFLAFWLVMLLLVWGGDFLPGRYISADFLWGIFLGGLILMLGGFLDDKYNLAPRWQILFPLLAIGTVIASGIGINYVTNPAGAGLLFLDRWQFTLFNFDGRAFKFVLLADTFTVVWLLGMMYTTKFLDGLDGLVSGMTVIGAFVIFALSLSPKTFQPDVALLALVLSGAALGFLIWNYHPAKIFLGEGGSVWVGFMLGVLAIISGGKVATALLVMGIPILDAGWVIFRRLLIEKRSPVQPDDKHLHFRLLQVFFSQKKAVLILWGLALFFGTASLFLQTRGKIFLLVLLLAIMIILGLWVTRRSKNGQ